MLIFNIIHIIRIKFTANHGNSHPREYYQNKSWVKNDYLEFIQANITIKDYINIYNIKKRKYLERVLETSFPLWGDFPSHALHDRTYVLF